MKIDYNQKEFMRKYANTRNVAMREKVFVRGVGKRQMVNICVMNAARKTLIVRLLLIKRKRLKVYVKDV